MGTVWGNDLAAARQTSNIACSVGLTRARGLESLQLLLRTHDPPHYHLLEFTGLIHSWRMIDRADD
jgi:hypothetical protein